MPRQEYHKTPMGDLCPLRTNVEDARLGTLPTQGIPRAVAIPTVLGIGALIAVLATAVWTSGRTDRAAAPTCGRSRTVRIVSLAPSVTEIIFRLGEGGSLVGATDHCDYPPEACAVDRVGGFGAPNVEKVLALCADVVIAAGFERAEAANEFRRHGIGVVDLQIRGFDELFEAVRRIGLAVGRAGEAEAMVGDMRARLDEARRRNGAAPEELRPRVFVEIWDRPLLTAGGGSFLNDVVAQAGGVNVANGIRQPYPCVDPEQVIAWNPNVVVATHGNGAAGRIVSRIGWSNTSAVATGSIVDDIPADLLVRPGPRLVDGVWHLAIKIERWHKTQGSFARRGKDGR